MAFAVVGVSSVLFVSAALYATVPLAPVPAFIASYQSALAINDLITAVLLFRSSRSCARARCCILASGYLFTAAAAIVPRLELSMVYLPRPDCSTLARRRRPWLYQIWHGGFPLCMVGYALLKGSDGGPTIRGSVGRAILGSIIAVGVTISVAAWVGHRQA